MSEEIEPDFWYLRVEDVIEMLSLYFHHEDRFSSRYGNKKEGSHPPFNDFISCHTKDSSVCLSHETFSHSLLLFGPEFTLSLFRLVGYSCPHVSLLTLLFLPLL